MPLPMGTPFGVAYIRPMTLRRDTWLVVALLAWAGSAQAASNGDEQPTFKALTSCVRGAAAVRGIDPGMVTKVLANGCSAACPGLAEYVTTNPRDDWRPLARCGLFCSPEARAAFEAAPPSQRWSVLADKCGADYYSLPAGDGAFLSRSWLVLLRIGAWLRKSQPAADPRIHTAVEDIQRSLADDRFLLPLPAVLAGRYALPQAGHYMGDFSARDYVLVGADSVFRGLMPEVTIRIDSGTRLHDPFPGDLIALDKLFAARATLRTPTTQVAFGGARGVLSPPPSSADQTLAVVRRNATLLIADKELPATRVVQTLEALGSDGAFLAIANSSGEVGGHSMTLTAKPVGMGAPTVHLTSADAVTDTPLPVAVGLTVQGEAVAALVSTLNLLYERGARLVVVEHVTPAPPVATGPVPKRGSIDKELIRRVIRGHLNDVKLCYEQAMLRVPDLAGRIMVQFVITPTGDVNQADAQDSTMADQLVEDCITAAVKRWQFPKPDGGGIVIVSYPFVLKSAP